MQNKNLRYATILALSTAAISGAANFINKFAVTAVKDPVLFTTFKNGIVALFLVGLILFLGRWKEIKNLTASQFKKLFLVGAVGGSLPFVLFFSGLAKTDAINASLIHKTLFLWVLIFAIPLLKEKISGFQWIGVGALFAANLTIGGFAGFKFNAGELMILAATILWAIENIIAKVALKDVSSLTVASARMVVGSILLMPLIAWRGGGIAPLLQLSPIQFSWVIVTAVFLTGYVVTWYAALKRAPATYVAALLVPATIVTNVLSAIFVTHAFAGRQFLAVLFYVAGIFAIIYFAKRTNVLKEQKLSATANQQN